MNKSFLFILFFLILSVLGYVLSFNIKCFFQNKFNKSELGVKLFVVDLEKNAWYSEEKQKKIISFFYGHDLKKDCDRAVLLGFVGLEGYSLQTTHDILSFYYNFFVKNGILNISIIPNFDWIRYKDIPKQPVVHYLSFSESALNQLKKLIALNISYDYFDLSKQKIVNNLNFHYPNFEDDFKVQSNYNTVVVSGTFDRLHPGHKLLLSTAYLHAKKKLLIMVTSGSLFYENKKHKDLIFSYQDRVKAISSFMSLIDDRGIQIDINKLKIPFPYDNKIDDVDPELINIDAIVVSRETYNAAVMVNLKRSKLNLKKMDIIAVDYVSRGKSSNDFKLSSSFLRENENRKVEC